jgi:5-methylcytosine-specific restriction endonuclease McrA
MNADALLPGSSRWRLPPRPWHTEFYTRYIGGPLWRTMRQRALARYGSRCQECGRDGPVQVHHVTYERLGHERLEDLRVLCTWCHRRADGERRARAARRA